MKTILNLIACLLYPNATRYCLLICIVLSFVIPYLCKPQIDGNLYSNLLSTIAGFSLAAMAILMSMSGAIIKALSNDLEEGKHCVCLGKNTFNKSNSKPIDDLFATVAIGVIVPVLGEIAYLFKDCSLCIDHNSIKAGFLCFSLLWSIHITIHIFSIRSFLRINAK